MHVGDRVLIKSCDRDIFNGLVGEVVEISTKTPQPIRVQVDDRTWTACFLERELVRLSAKEG